MNDEHEPDRYVALSRLDDWTIVGVSEAFAELLGYTPDELIGRSGWELINQPEDELEPLRRRAEVANEWGGVSSLRTRNGETIDMAFVFVKLAGGLGVTFLEPSGEPGSTGVERLRRTAHRLLILRADLEADEPRPPGRARSLRALPDS